MFLELLLLARQYLYPLVLSKYIKLEYCRGFILNRDGTSLN